MKKNELYFKFLFRVSQGNKMAEENKGQIAYYWYFNGCLQFERKTGIRCFRDEWDSDKKLFVGPNAKMKNMELNRVIHILEQQQVSFLVTGSTKLLGQKIHETPQDRKKLLLKAKSLLEVIDEYNDFQFEKIRRFGMKKHLGNIEESTYNSYLKRRNCLLVPFLQLYRMEQILISDIDVKFLERFDIWITTQPTKDGKSRGQAYATKAIKYVKTVMNFAVKEGYLDNNKANFYKTKNDSPKPVKTLTKGDIERLESCEFMSKQEEKALDMFLFAHETLLHYGDYYDLDENHIKTDREGQKWIVKTRKKATEEDRQVQRVPLSEKALLMIEKYGGVENLPKMSNGYVNYWLKVIADRVGLEKHVMFKMGRSAAISHSFNEKNMRSESIVILAGWTSPRQIASYLEPDLGSLKNEFLTQNTTNNASMFQI